MANNPAFYLNPASSMTGVLDFSQVETRKVYHKATACLDKEELFDCTPENMHHFLKMFCQRANEYGWDDDVTGVLMIPDDHQNPASDLKYLPTHYGEISMEQIDLFEKSYLGGTQRSAQDSYIIYKCLMNSLSKEGKMKIESWENEYQVTNDAGTMVPSGNLLLKVIIRESHLDTNATTQSIRMKLSNLDKYIVKIDSDVTKFNSYVKLLVNSLAARGKRTEDLLTQLFKGYLAASDKMFVKYINEKMERYEEGEDMHSDTLMQLADNKFRLMKERGTWDAPSAEEEKILALQTEVEKLKKRKSVYKRDTTRDKKLRAIKKKSGKGPKKQKQQEKPAWMHQRPDEKDLHKPRKWNGKEWWFCHPDTGGKCDGEYRRHKPSQCEGKAFKKGTNERSAGKGKEPNEDTERSLKVANALSTMIEEDEYGTESEASSDGYSS